MAAIDPSNVSKVIQVQTSDNGTPINPKYGQIVLYRDGKIKGVNDRNQVVEPVPDASATQQGIIQIATQAEANALTETKKAVAPATIPKASTTQQGIVRFATPAETTAGTLNNVAVAPDTLVTKLLSMGFGNIAAGSYTGDGQNITSSNQKTISDLPFQPKLLLVNGNRQAGIMTPPTGMYFHGVGPVLYVITVSITTSSISWYTTTDLTALNVTGTVYNYVIFG